MSLKTTKNKFCFKNLKKTKCILSLLLTLKKNKVKFVFD